MFNTFSTALSALRAESSAIAVVGNNLANLNTVGFKASEVDFHDLISQQIGVASQSNQIGMGVGQIDAVRDFSQGAIQATQGATDAAIEGNGFFIVKDSNNQQLFTRNGSFQIDSAGNLTSVTGENVQGWNAVNGVLTPNGPVSNITIPLGATIPAKATTTMSVDVNLNAATPANKSTDPKNPDPGSVFSAPIQVYDSQGAAHTLTVTFTKTDVNKWSYDVTIPSSDLKSPGSTPQTSVLSAPGNLVFDGNGNLSTPAPPVPPATAAPIDLKVAGLADGATDISINWNLFGSSANSLITQFAQASGVSATQQDGSATGQIVRVAISDGGMLVANYSNGQQVNVAQIALATMTNPDSLVAVGNNDLQASAQTSPISVGTANSGGRGQIAGGALESSTSDIATEFTNLLTFQRSYQAASRVITTSDQLLQETVNLIHP